MNRIARIILHCIALILCFLPLNTGAQAIVRVDVDSVACAGNPVRVGIGYGMDREIGVENTITTLTHPERAFLPDGVPCGAMGCSYRSPVTFSGFTSGATITSANDINYIRVNLEHSFIGDLYINITCPNGQVASLMNWAGTGSSSCSSTVPSNHRHWSSGSNASGGTYFGLAYDYANSSYKCDPTAEGNDPGVGWNYCWSSNTLNGYSYAPGDALIYRSANAHNGSIDSSNVAAHTNFYHPDDHFAALVGCPLNGNWYIEVLDAYNQDNGYIFEWELSLNPNLLPLAGTMDSCTVLGDTVMRFDDSTFYVSSPSSATAQDTTITYTARIYGSNGNLVDTTFSVRYIQQRHRLFNQALCDGDTLRIDDLVITTTTDRIDTLPWVTGCPQIREIHALFNPRYEHPDTAYYCPYDSLIYSGILYPTSGDYILNLTTTEGCDSIVHLSLITLDTSFRARPYISDNPAEGWYNDTMLAGCIPFDVWFRDSTDFCASRSWHTGDTGWFATTDSVLTHTYDSAGIFTVTLAVVSPHGCRDTAQLKNAVWTFETPEADFTWAPEHPVMSHPEAELIAIEDTGTMSYMWEVPRGSGAGDDTLYGAVVNYSWFTEGDNVSGDFEVTLSAIRSHITPYGAILECIDTAKRTITIVNDWLQFPNLVTPNGDGINDIWKVVNLLECGEYSMNELWIYNRWGGLVYHAKNIRQESDFWDPEKTSSTDGTYYFLFSAKSIHGIIRRTGEIEVVR